MRLDRILDRIPEQLRRLNMEQLNYPSVACLTCMYRFRPKTEGTCKVCIEKGVQYRKKCWRKSELDSTTKDFERTGR